MRRVVLAVATGLTLHAQVPDLRWLNIVHTLDLLRGVTHLAVEIRKDWKPKPELRSWCDPSGSHPAEWKAFLANRYPARKLAGDPVPGAVVEIWGNAPWARQDEFKAFAQTNLPAFRTAFDAGYSASVGRDHLANLMAGDPSTRPPHIGSKVWNNAFEPWAQGKTFPR